MNNPGTEYNINPRYTPERASPESTRLLERFQSTSVKITIQKDGALTDIARSLLLDTYGIYVPPTPKGRVPITISDDGETGFIYARNKDICSLVTAGAVDLAIVGTDRIIEDGAEDKVEIIASYDDRYSWPLVLATPIDTPVKRADDISRVATQYPVITQRYFESIGRPDVEVVQTAGNTELYPYLGTSIDAVVDLTSSGESLAAHNLAPWTPAISTVYPVLIQAQRTANPES